MHIAVYRQRANIQPGAHGQGASLQAAWAAASKKVNRGKLDRRKALIIMCIYIYIIEGGDTRNTYDSYDIGIHRNTMEYHTSLTLHHGSDHQYISITWRKGAQTFKDCNAFKVCNATVAWFV